MERSYLIAALAIIATFSGFTRGVRSLEQWTLLHFRQTGTLARSECHASAAARAIARIKTRLRPQDAEQAQLLAQMSVPAAEAQAAIAQQMAAQSAESARARAMQEAERARRNVLRMQRDMAEVSQQIRIEPLSLQVDLPPDVERQIQQSTALAARMAAIQTRLHIVVDHPNCPTNRTSQ